MSLLMNLIYVMKIHIKYGKMKLYVLMQFQKIIILIMMMMHIKNVIILAKLAVFLEQMRIIIVIVAKMNLFINIMIIV